MANLIKRLDNRIRKIPDFYEPEFNPGRRDCMKGLSFLTGGALAPMVSMSLGDETSFNVGLSLAVAGGILFLGYVGRGIYKTIKSELNDYKLELS